MKSVYVGETVNYFDRQDLERIQIVCIDNRWYNKQGLYSSSITLDEEHGTGDMIVVHPYQHTVFVHHKVRGRVHHSSFFGGQPVLFAGLAFFQNGLLEKCVAWSGHYGTPRHLLSLIPSLSRTSLNVLMFSKSWIMINEETIHGLVHARDDGIAWISKENGKVNVSLENKSLSFLAMGVRNDGIAQISNENRKRNGSLKNKSFLFLAVGVTASHLVFLFRPTSTEEDKVTEKTYLIVKIICVKTLQSTEIWKKVGECYHAEPLCKNASQNNSSHVTFRCSFMQGENQLVSVDAEKQTVEMNLQEGEDRLLYRQSNLQLLQKRQETDNEMVAYFERETDYVPLGFSNREFVFSLDGQWLFCPLFDWDLSAVHVRSGQKHKVVCQHSLFFTLKHLIVAPSGTWYYTISEKSLIVYKLEFTDEKWHANEQWQFMGPKRVKFDFSEASVKFGASSVWLCYCDPSVHQCWVVGLDLKDGSLIMRETIQARKVVVMGVQESKTQETPILTVWDEGKKTEPFHVRDLCSFFRCHIGPTFATLQCLESVDCLQMAVVLRLKCRHHVCITCFRKSDSCLKCHDSTPTTLFPYREDWVAIPSHDTAQQTVSQLHKYGCLALTHRPSLYCKWNRAPSDQQMKDLPLPVHINSHVPLTRGWQTIPDRTMQSALVCVGAMGYRHSTWTVFLQAVHMVFYQYPKEYIAEVALRCGTKLRRGGYDEVPAPIYSCV